VLALIGAIDSRSRSDFHILSLSALHDGKLDERFDSRADPITAHATGWETASGSDSKFRQSSESKRASSPDINTLDYNTGFGYVDANIYQGIPYQISCLRRL